MHIKYHCRPGAYDVDWDYSLGYKIHHKISDAPVECRTPSTKDIPSTWHSQGGWQSICWGYFAEDDEEDYDAYDYENGPDTLRIEEGEVGLHKEGVLDIYQVLFGPIDAPPSDDAEAVLQYRKKLVATVENRQSVK